MTISEEADAQLAQLIKDYPTLEDLENSLAGDSWQEIKGGYVWEEKDGGLEVVEDYIMAWNKVAKWNPILEDRGQLYIVVNSNGDATSLGQYFDFKQEDSFHGGKANHRYIGVDPHIYDNIELFHFQRDELNWDYEMLHEGEWAKDNKFFLYAPAKWITINWKNNPFEVKS